MHAVKNATQVYYYQFKTFSEVTFSDIVTILVRVKKQHYMNVVGPIFFMNALHNFYCLRKRAQVQPWWLGR